MEVDPLETLDQVDALTRQEADQGRARRLNMAVAASVALLATFMGICKVKDDNIVQAMQQAQADKLDHWAYYQARNIRQEVAEAALTQLELTPATDAAARDKAVERYRQLAAEQARKKDELKALAEQDQQHYDALNYRDDQFDLSDALLALAISLLAVTAVTGLWWLYWLSLVPVGFGVLMGLAGLLGWSVHPSALIALLS